MDMKLDLFELLLEFPEATLTVHAGDLGHFARELLAEARQEFPARARCDRERKRAEEYLTPEMVKTLLRISESTLYRMAKAKILSSLAFVRRTETLPAFRPRQDPVSPRSDDAFHDHIQVYVEGPGGSTAPRRNSSRSSTVSGGEAKLRWKSRIRTVTEITGLSRTLVIMTRALLEKGARRHPGDPWKAHPL